MIAQPLVEIENPRFGPKSAGRSTPDVKRLNPNDLDIQGKLVLLAMTFPRLRIIWSSSPQATVNIFRDLKKNQLEPDVNFATEIGLEGSASEKAAMNQTLTEIVRALPGVTSKNYQWLMSKTRNIFSLTTMSRDALQLIIGNQPGKACYDFMHFKDDKKKK